MSKRIVNKITIKTKTKCRKCDKVIEGKIYSSRLSFLGITRYPVCEKCYEQENCR